MENNNDLRDPDKHKEDGYKFMAYPQMPMVSYQMQICPTCGNPMYCPMLQSQSYFPMMTGQTRDDYDDFYEYDEVDEDEYLDEDTRQRPPRRPRRRRRRRFPISPRPYFYPYSPYSRSYYGWY